MSIIKSIWTRFKTRGNPDYKFTWGPEKAWDYDSSAKRS